jgi:single-strand DNA-binding protein
MANFNRVFMIGNLTRDPELKSLPSGQTVCKFTLASNRHFKNKTGTTTQEVCYIDVDTWGQLADSCGQHLRKGRQVLVEGRLKQDTWKDSDGQTRSKHGIVADQVVFLGPPQTEASPDGSLPGETTVDASLASRRLGPTPQPEASSSASKPTASPVVGGSTLFKDEPAFEDDLPF